jgi:CheY-like chemotaxis protein
MSIMQKVIMVVEDNVQILALIVEILEAKGYSVYPAESVTKASAVLDCSRVDLILSDYQIKEDGKSFIPTGADVARYVQAKNLAVPVILMTANSSAVKPDEIDLFTTILDKPLDMNELNQVIKELLNPVEA